MVAKAYIKPARFNVLSLADLTPGQIRRVVEHAYHLKTRSQPWLEPQGAPMMRKAVMPPQSLFLKSIALLFSKRSTRTRISAETAAELLGGRALFLGKEDIQLGVNESMRDSARVISGMCQGIFARVGDHSEIEELAKHSEVPVLNALSSLWHPTQTLADLLTIHEHAGKDGPFYDTNKKSLKKETETKIGTKSKGKDGPLPNPKPLTIAWLGDSTNVLHDMLVAYPRLGHNIRVATPRGAAYRCPTPVWDEVERLGCAQRIWWGSNPREAVEGADLIVTDTWISMGQEAEKAQRLKDFQGYQVTEELCQNAQPNWQFMHCLPRKPDEVDDNVFYNQHRSLVFQESDNRKWTIMALFDLLFGKWEIGELESKSQPAKLHAQIEKRSEQV